MITFNDYKNAYGWGWIGKDFIYRLVTLDKITPEQYKEITGEVIV